MPASLGTPGLSLRLPVGPRPAACGWPVRTVSRPCPMLAWEPTTPFSAALGRHPLAYIDNLIISIALMGHMLGKFVVVQVGSAMLHLVHVAKEINMHLLEPYVACWTLGARAPGVAVTPQKARPPSLTDEARGEVADRDRLKHLLMGYSLQPLCRSCKKTLNTLSTWKLTCLLRAGPTARVRLQPMAMARRRGLDDEGLVDFVALLAKHLWPPPVTRRGEPKMRPAALTSVDPPRNGRACTPRQGQEHLEDAQWTSALTSASPRRSRRACIPRVGGSTAGRPEANCNGARRNPALTSPTSVVERAWNLVAPASRRARRRATAMCTTAGTWGTTWRTTWATATSIMARVCGSGAPMVMDVFSVRKGIVVLLLGKESVRIGEGTGQYTPILALPENVRRILYDLIVL